MPLRVRDDALRIRSSARIYQLSASISKALAARAFGEIHDARGSEETLMARRKLAVGDLPVTVDYTIFSYEAEPSFLEGTDISELRYGLVVIVQYREHACVVTMGGASFPDAGIETVARRVAADVITDLEDGEKIQSYSSQTMSWSGGGIRSRTLAGDDIGANVASMSRSRQVLTTFRACADGGTRTDRPSTGHVSASAPRARLQELVRWVAAEIDKIHAQSAHPAAARSAFVQSFARYIKRDALPGGVQPTAVFVDLSTLEEGIVDGSIAVFVKSKRGAPPTPIPDDVALGAIRLFGEPGIVEPHETGAASAVARFGGVVAPFALNMNKQSYSLSCSLLKNVQIGDRRGSNLRSIAEWVRDPDHEALFVSMNDIRFAFALGHLVQDDHILALAPSLLTCLHPIPALSGCISEKGEAALTARSTSFPVDSVFGAIEGQIAKEPALVCDDLGDEWADYIGIDEPQNRITLYHAKHGARTSSATTFQTVVGQAVKNLGRIGIFRDDLDGKKQGWRQPYRLDKITTGISRIRRGETVEKVARAYEDVAMRPARSARVALVLSFLSRAEVEESFQRIRQSGAMRGWDPRRVWLISSFVSMCQDAAAEPVIYCAP